jgi:uncharacterized protein (DUF697 family)
MIWDYIIKRRFKPSDRERATTELTDKCGYAAAALTMVPVPGTELMGVMPVHVGMVTAIAHIHDKDISKDSATKLVMRIGATVGLSLVGSRAATTAAKIIMPGLGGIVAAPFMFASTKALGSVAKAYFEREEELSAGDIKAVYEAAAKKAKSEFRADKLESDEVQASADALVNLEAEAAPRGATERLSELKGMLEQGLIEEADYADAKTRILGEL